MELALARADAQSALRAAQLYVDVPAQRHPAQRLGRAVDGAEDVALDAAAQDGDDASELCVVGHPGGCC